MEPHDDTGPLLADATLPPREGLNKRLIYGLLLVGGVAAFVLAVWGVSRLMMPPTPPPAVVNEAPAMQTPIQPLDPYVKVPTTFANLDRRPPIPEAQPVPPLPVEKPPPAATPAPPVTQSAPPQTAKPAQSASPKPTPRRGPQPWLFATPTLGKPVFGGADKSKTDQEQGKQNLLHDAAWVKPVDPTRILYRDQAIHAITLRNINSDIPGDITLMTTRDVVDILGQGRVLIPQFAIITTKQEGKPAYGDSRLPLSVEQIRFADGTLVPLKAKVADKSGAVGMPGDVNNHIPRVILSAAISAVLSIGSRAVAGNSTSYQPTIEQEFAQDVSRSINSSGQKIVQRELNVAPTITAKAGDVVTLQLGENLNFAKDPTPVR